MTTKWTARPLTCGDFGRQVRSLPEHTVDCWVSWAVIDRYSEALLWAPTQHGADNWDMAFRALGGGKCLIFENKGTFGGYTDPYRHVIKIDLLQLVQYLLKPSAPVYYVLPSPPWKSTASTPQLDPAAPVAIPALCRTGTNCARSDHPTHGAFDTWATVIPAFDLLRLVHDRTPRWSHQKTVDIPSSVVQGEPGAVTLREFLSGLEICRQGGPRHESADAASQHWQQIQQQTAHEVFDLIGQWYGRAEVLGHSGVRTGVLAAFVPVPALSQFNAHPA